MDEICSGKVKFIIETLRLTNLCNRKYHYHVQPTSYIKHLYGVKNVWTTSYQTTYGMQTELRSVAQWKDMTGEKIRNITWNIKKKNSRSLSYCPMWNIEKRTKVEKQVKKLLRVSFQRVRLTLRNSHQ